MKGGVRKRGTTWSYYFDLGTLNGKRKKKEKGGFKTKKECENALRNAIVEYENGGYLAPKELTLSQFSYDWLENYIKPLRKITTYNRYRELLYKYIDNSIGNIILTEIQSYTVEQLLLNIKLKASISNSTLQSIYTLLNTIFNRALKLKLIKDNPCKYVDRPKREKFKPAVLCIEEIPVILGVLDLTNEHDFMFNIAVKITLELGLRRGELAGLEWSDINFKQNTLTVKNNLIYTNGHVTLTTPKTLESCRTLYVSNNLIKLLKDINQKQLKNRLLYGSFYEKNIFDGKAYDLIMRWDSGKYIHPMYYTNKLKKVLKASDIDKDVRWHDLRHTNATLLLSQGVDFKVIQERLGHTDIGTTLNIYSHVSNDMQKKASEKLNPLIYGGNMVAK